MRLPTLAQLRARLSPKPTAARPPAAIAVGTRAAAGATRPQIPAQGTTLSLRVHDPQELEIYRQIRNCFPVLDIGLTKFVQLIGTPEIQAGATLKAELEQWAEGLHVVPASGSLNAWLAAHLGSMLLYGKGVTSAYLSPTRRDLAAVEVLDPRFIRFENTPDLLNLRTFYRRPQAPGEVELPARSTLLSLHAPECSPHGTSILRATPFIADALNTINNATAQLWQRIGNPSFNVNWQPEAGFNDPDGVIAAEVTADLEASWTEMMTAKRTGQVRDFFTTGNITITAIGHDAQITEVQAPARLFTEQLAAVTGLPPWMLGLHWSSTERLSVQQADMLAANIEAIRREVHPQAEQLIELRQAVTGRRGKWSLKWPTIDLRDATEQARARAWNANADATRLTNARAMWELGFWSQLRAAQHADPELLIVDYVMQRPPAHTPGRPDVPPPPPSDANAT